MIRVVVSGSRIGRRRRALLSIAVAVCVLAVPAVACAEESQSAETLTVEAPSARLLGEPMPVTVAGTAGGLDRLFVYGQPWQATCKAWPYEEEGESGVVPLTSTEGEPLGAGPFSKVFTVTTASSPYAACAYLDSTPFANPEAYASGCWEIPSRAVSFPEVQNPIDCFITSDPWWAIVGGEEDAKRQLETYQREHKHQEELEKAQQREAEEAAANASESHGTTGTADYIVNPNKLCRVPALRRHTLGGVRHLLREADCRLGRLTIRHHDHGTLVVKSQNPQHGKTLAANARVSIVLGPRTG
jgi:hypothetical protein